MEPAAGRRIGADKGHGPVHALVLRLHLHHIRRFRKGGPVTGTGHQLDQQFVELHAAGMHGHGHMEGLAVQQAVFLDPFDADGVHLHGAEAHVDILLPVGQVAGQGVMIAADLQMTGGGRDVVVTEVVAQHAV